MLLNRLTPGDTAHSYVTFRLTFWIDRLLVWTTVIVPLVAASLLILLHAATDTAKCHLPASSPAAANTRQADYLNRYCALQLADNILIGSLANQPSKKSQPQSGSLQHEYYPFLLLISVVFLWLPHVVFLQAVNAPLRRNLVLVRNELLNFRENTMRELNRRGDNSETNLVDFSASVSELPLLPSVRIDWSLSHYLAMWQDSDFFVRRYVTKHLIIFMLQTVVFLTIFCVLCVHSGAPFAPGFDCLLPETLLKSSQHGTFIPKKTECVLQSTFVVNISVIILYLANIASLLAQSAFFYINFSQSRYSFAENRYFDACFFGSYIRLLAYSLFREVHKVHDVHVNLCPGFLRTDFHFLSLLCAENQDLLTDSFFIHYWTERFMRANRKRQYIQSESTASAAAGVAQAAAAGRFRRTSFGLLTSEDVSERLHFTKMKLKVELNDMLW